MRTSSGIWCKSIVCRQYNGRVIQTALDTVLKTVGVEMLGARHLTLSPKGVMNRISAGTYVKILLQKRNMSQVDLLRKMQSLGFDGVHKTHINNFINGTDTTTRYPLIRKIEIALDLPEFILINMVGRPSEAKIKQLKEIKANEK